MFMTRIQIVDLGLEGVLVFEQNQAGNIEKPV